MTLFLGVSHTPFQGGWATASPKFLQQLPTLKQFDLERRNFVWRHSWGSIACFYRVSQTAPVSIWHS